MSKMTKNDYIALLGANAEACAFFDITVKRTLRSLGRSVVTCWGAMLDTAYFNFMETSDGRQVIYIVPETVEDAANPVLFTYDIAQNIFLPVSLLSLPRNKDAHFYIGLLASNKEACVKFDISIAVSAIEGVNKGVMICNDHLKTARFYTMHSTDKSNVLYVAPSILPALLEEADDGNYSHYLFKLNLSSGEFSNAGLHRYSSNENDNLRNAGHAYLIDYAKRHDRNMSVSVPGYDLM
jgi:hypothetical protein